MKRKVPENRKIKERKNLLYSEVFEHHIHLEAIREIAQPSNETNHVFTKWRIEAINIATSFETPLCFLLFLHHLFTKTTYLGGAERHTLLAAFEPTHA